VCLHQDSAVVLRARFIPLRPQIREALPPSPKGRQRFSRIPKPTAPANGGSSGQFFFLLAGSPRVEPYRNDVFSICFGNKFRLLVWADL